MRFQGLSERCGRRSWIYAHLQGEEFVATSEESGELSAEQLQAIETRRAELLERIKTIDPASIQGLMLTTGAARSADVAGESFHEYWFASGGGFQETFVKYKAAEEQDADEYKQP